MIDQKKVLELLKSQDLCVLSTASLSGKPESAVMALTIRDDFTIFMSTEPTTRKIKNILENSQVSVVVGGLKGDPSIQIDGTARVLDDTEAKEAVGYMLSVKPQLKEYGIDTGKIISIKPQWFRFMDYSQNPPSIFDSEF